MKKLILITGLILSQLICFCQTPGVNLLSDRVGINIANPNRQFEILGLDNTLDHVFYSRTNFTGFEDIRAIEGWSQPEIGYGIGGYFTGGYKGLYSLGSGSSYGGTVYGVHAHASGSSGTRIGIKASASGGTTNLAAELGPGDVHILDDLEVSDNLGVGTTANQGRLHINNVNTVIGSNAAATRINVSHNGPETTYGSFITAVGSGAGNVFGIHNTASSTNPSSTVFGIYSYTPVSDGWAMYAAGKAYISDDLRIGTQADPYSGLYKLILDGKMIAEEVRVQNSLDWPDYVFREDYKLLSLPQLEAYIQKHNHLPNIPSASEVEKEGILLGEMQIKLMEKVEELTLHLIAQQKEIEILKNQLNLLSDEK
ncbi:MAG: hypothetical protein ACJA1A_001386 [Saprospiraceae bacterium]|jgi:hypothetical protein